MSIKLWFWKFINIINERRMFCLKKMPSISIILSSVFTADSQAIKMQPVSVETSIAFCALSLMRWTLFFHETLINFYEQTENGTCFSTKSLTIFHNNSLRVSSKFSANIHLIPSVDLLWKFRENCGTPSMASVRTARRPTVSTKTAKSMNSHIKIPPRVLNNNIKCR